MVYRIAGRLGLCAALVGIASLPHAALAGGEGWSHDIAKAMKDAASENKHILMDFTGSDWCGYCIKLNEEIFSQDGFKDVIPKNFVLVEFDFPRDQTKLSEETIKQNEEWRDKLGVEGFPAIYLATADGKPYAQTGYRRGNTPDEYAAHLTELRGAKQVSDKALAKSKDASGKEKAALLDKVIANESILVDGRDEIIDQIIALDTDGELGLKEKYETIRLRQQIAKDVDQIRNLAVRGNIKKALKKMDGLLDKYKLEGEEAQEVLVLKIQLLVFASEPEAALAAADEIIALAPNSDVATQIASFKPRLEEMVADVVKAREAAEAEDAPKDGTKETVKDADDAVKDAVKDADDAVKVAE